MDTAEMPAEKENSDPAAKHNKPGLSSIRGGALLYNVPSRSSSSPPHENWTSKPGVLPLSPSPAFRTPGRQQQQQPFSTTVSKTNKAPPTPAISQMPAPATPTQHHQQPPSTPLATPSAKKGSEVSLEVFARLRPPAEKGADKGEGTGRTYEILGDGTLLRLVPPPGAKSSQAKEYTFKRVFGAEATQEMVFEGAALPLVDGVCNGVQNALLVMYGMSGGGKTHTTVGTKADMGLLPRALTHIFQKVDTTTTTVAMSFVEIYMDKVYDLQVKNAGSRAPLELKNGASASAFVEGLSSTRVSSVNHGLSFFERANQQRVVGATQVNNDSSRSHLVCMTTVESRGKKRFLWIVDLAGSERGRRTQVKACSTRQREGNSINTSLSTLFQCFKAMLKKQQFVPFRDSKLTHLLGYLLQGPAAGKTVMVANINPSVSDFDETRTVCENVAEARQVTMTLGLNEDFRQGGGGIWDCNGHRVAWASTVKRPSLKSNDQRYSLVAGAATERKPRRRRSRSADTTERIRFSHGSSCSVGAHVGHDPGGESDSGVVSVTDRRQSPDQPAREKELFRQAKEELSMALLEGELATAAADESQRRVVELTEQLAEERQGSEEAKEVIARLQGKLRQTEEQLKGSRRVEQELSGALEASGLLERSAREEAQAARAAMVTTGVERAKMDDEAREVAAKEIADLRDELASAKEGEAGARSEILRQQAATAASEEARTSAVARVEALECEVSCLRNATEAAAHAAHDTASVEAAATERLSWAQSEVAEAQAEVGVLKEQLVRAEEEDLRSNESKQDAAAVASVDCPYAMSESLAHPAAEGEGLLQQQQPLSVSDEQDSLDAEFDDIGGGEGRASFWMEYDDVGGGNESTFDSDPEKENEGAEGVIEGHQHERYGIAHEQDEKEENEENEEEEEATPAASAATTPTLTATTPLSAKDTAEADRPTSKGDEGRPVEATAADNHEKRLADDVAQPATTEGMKNLVVGSDGKKRLHASLFCSDVDIGSGDALAGTELFDGKYFSEICYEVPAGTKCNREGCKWQDESHEHYHLRCGCRTKKSVPLTFKAAGTAALSMHEVRDHLLPLHRSDPVQAAEIMPPNDREKLKLRAYNPWPVTHSAHLGIARPVRLGEEPDWKEAADSLRDEFDAKYTPEECLIEWRRTAYPGGKNVSLDWLDVETKRFRRLLKVFSKSPYATHKFDFVAAHLPGRNTEACHRKSTSEKYKRDSGL